MVAVGYDNALIDHLVDNQKEVQKDFPLLLPQNLKSISLKERAETLSPKNNSQNEEKKSEDDMIPQ